MLPRDSEKGHVTMAGHFNPLCNPETSTKKTFKHAALPRIEWMLYLLVSIAGTVYTVYRVAVISKGIARITFES